MDLPTYTNIWRIEKRLYKLYDFRLPMPLPVGTFGVALGVFALWVVLLSILNAPFAFGNGWHLVLWVVPPGVITVLATRPVMEGKRLTELLISQARFLAEARVYTRLAPEYEPSEVRVAVRVWHRDPEAGPLVMPRRRRADRGEVETDHAEIPVEDTAPARPVPGAAPPLRGIAAPAASAPAVGDAPAYVPVASEPAPARAGERTGRTPVGADERGDRAPARASSPAPSVTASSASTAATEAAPVRAEVRDAAARAERAPDRARATASPAKAPERRVPVAVAASHSESEDRSRADAWGEEPRGSDSYGTSAGDPGTPDGPRRRVGRRVLNYFGWGLGPGRPDPADAPDPDEDDDRDEGDFTDDRVYATESGEQRASDAWFADLRASSGETPVGLTSKSAYSVGDTGALSRDDLADAVAPADRAPARERRRAEEAVSAAEPDDDESPAARRLRGRTQGIQVAKDLDERRTDQVRERGPKEQRPVRAQGLGLPAPESDPPRGGGRPAADRTQERPRRRGRPHAAPWDLGEGRAAQEPAAGPADLSDYAARFAAATGRPPNETAVPWLPPASAAPVEETREETRQEAREETREDDPERAPRGRAETAPARDTEDTRDGEDARGAGAAETAPEPPAVEPAAAPAPADAGRDTPRPARPAPPLEMDHGTGEQDAMHRSPEDEPEDRGPEWNAHMSVLDKHLITVDTPAPPCPTFADAVPVRDEPRDTAEWFEDGKKRHPDQPKIGDRGNPVIPASELREDTATASPDTEDTAETADSPDAGAGSERGDAVVADTEVTDAEAAPEADVPEPEPTAPADENKPPTQLDHGTGELVSFAEVRHEPERADRNVRADADGESARRRTVSDLEEAEAAALARRRASTGRATDADGVRPHGARSEIARAEAARAQDPGPDSAPAGAQTRARWSMRATGAAEAAHPAEGVRPAHDAEAGTHGERPARDPRGNPSMAGATREAPGSEDLWSAGAPAADTATAAADEDPDREPDRTAGSGDAAHGAERDRQPGEEHRDDADLQDGVFHRVAQNARRLGQLFGQPAPGEEPAPAREVKPQLELDHGTGEQERLGDTPNGVPSQRPLPPAPVREPEAPVLRGEPGGSDSGGTRGWRRLAKVVTGGAAPVRSDLPPSDIERLRTPLEGARSLVVLGCTGGAGQTVTALMIGHTLAAHRDDLVVAVDVNPGPNGLSRRVGAQTPETLTALLANADGIDDYARMSDYTSQSGTGLEVVQTLDDPYVQTLDDRDYAQLASLLGSFYGVTLLDPAATGVARALPVADGLVLVAPANADAERAVSMTFDWLDGNGYNALRANAVLVVNGVSKRSLQDVDAAERVARGRCRAIVRIPWDDHLGSSYTRIDVGALRPATKRAHGALGGVLVNALVR